MENEVCNDKRGMCAHKTIFESLTREPPPSYLHMLVQTVKVKG